MKRPPEKIVQQAVALANLSPCKKSQRGVVIFNREDKKVEIIGRGFNAQPKPFKCTGSDFCRNNCAKLCVHAEQEAIQSISEKIGPNSCELLHIKTVKGKAVYSGLPSCWQCSRQILKKGLKGVWLYHKKGWKFYNSLEFHKLTLEHCDIKA
jgi:deoxycytidylate deaminase